MKLVLVGAGLFALMQLILAGFGFINASGDSQKLSQARDKIIWALVGILIVFGSFVLMAIIGIIFFKDPMIFIQPSITGAPPTPMP
jgi:hypothetical protein